MKLRHILLIIAVIIAAHGAVLYFCLRQPAAPSVQTPAKLEKTALPSAAPDSSALSASGRNQENAAVSTDTASVPQKTAATIQRFPAFNYRYAWQGNIPELPGSAGAKAGILVDANTGNVLWDKQARNPYQIASMTKIMTALLAYEDVLAGRDGITLSTQIPVTRAAQKIGGSQVWLDVRETFTLEELLKAVSIKSANDAAYLVAEFLGGGDVAGFVDRMNRRARELGMNHTRFFNPHGLPGSSSREDNVSSPADMALLAERSLSHAKLLEWASTVSADFREPGQRGHLKIVNHNNLLPGRKYPATGVDGLKTGFINRSGYCVTTTCLRGGKRMIAVVVGFDMAKNRDLFVRKLLDWGYSRASDPAAANQRSHQRAAELRAKAAQPKKQVQKKAPVRKKNTGTAKKKSR